MRRTMKITGLYVVVFFALATNLVHADGATILAAGGIDLDNTILAGQSVSISSSQYTPTDTTILAVTSLLNKELSASFTQTTSDASGFWSILLIGTGGRNWANFAYGLIGPSGGPSAKVDIDEGLSFGIAICTTNVTSNVSEANPFKYQLRIAGTAYQ